MMERGHPEFHDTINASEYWVQAVATPDGRAALLFYHRGKTIAIEGNQKGIAKIRRCLADAEMFLLTPPGNA